MDILQRSAIVGSFQEFLAMFTGQFTSSEMAAMVYDDDENMQYATFYVNWALKEAFVKAIGRGLSYDLLSVSQRQHSRDMS